MTKIKYIIGDATQPVGDGHKLIVHIVNDVGKWGAGFAVPLGKRWPKAKIEYMRWIRGERKRQESPYTKMLGAVRFVCVEENITIANMCCQHGTRKTRDSTPLKYRHLIKCLGLVAYWAMHMYDDSGMVTTAHMPRIGSGLGGGDWGMIEKIIEEGLCVFGISVFVYDLED